MTSRCFKLSPKDKCSKTWLSTSMFGVKETKSSLDQLLLAVTYQCFDLPPSCTLQVIVGTPARLEPKKGWL